MHLKNQPYRMCRAFVYYASAKIDIDVGTFHAYEHTSNMDKF